MVKIPVQGDIVLVEVSSTTLKQTKQPYMVISHSLVGQHSNLVTLVPIRQTDRDYPLHIDISEREKLKTTGKVLLDQVVTIDYATRKWWYFEKATNQLLDEVLVKVKTIFQKNN